ncbi:MAG TPA: zf-TFIIB domain-containing protein [Kofleriaceae bacterium]|nr:zf-TFIIB domain-containing protein [Kofleriaceae bacterium]
MPFRDRPPSCPRCRVELDRIADDERFRCSGCAGVVLDAGVLVTELLAVDPSLRDGIRIRDVRTIGRRTNERLPCALCGEAMEPVFLGGVEIDRCHADGVLWFDVGELEEVLTRTAEQRDDRSVGLLRRLFGLARQR